MSPAIDNPASCKIRTVTHFLHAKNMSAAEIHHELCAVVYGQNGSEGTVRQWCRMFKDGRTDVLKPHTGVKGMLTKAKRIYMFILYAAHFHL
jgi:hypothetical protein